MKATEDRGRVKSFHFLLPLQNWSSDFLFPLKDWKIGFMLISDSIPHACNREIYVHTAPYKSLRKLSCIQRFPLE